MKSARKQTSVLILLSFSAVATSFSTGPYFDLAHKDAHNAVHGLICAGHKVKSIIPWHEHTDGKDPCQDDYIENGAPASQGEPAASPQDQPPSYQDPVNPAQPPLYEDPANSGQPPPYQQPPAYQEPVVAAQPLSAAPQYGNEQPPPANDPTMPQEDNLAILADGPLPGEPAEEHFGSIADDNEAPENRQNGEMRRNQQSQNRQQNNYNNNDYFGDDYYNGDYNDGYYNGQNSEANPQLQQQRPSYSQQQQQPSYAPQQQQQPSYAPQQQQPSYAPQQQQLPQQQPSYTPEQQPLQQQQQQPFYAPQQQEQLQESEDAEPPEYPEYDRDNASPQSVVQPPQDDGQPPAEALEETDLEEPAPPVPPQQVQPPQNQIQPSNNNQDYPDYPQDVPLEQGVQTIPIEITSDGVKIGAKDEAENEQEDQEKPEDEETTAVPQTQARFDGGETLTSVPKKRCRNRKHKHNKMDSGSNFGQGQFGNGYEFKPNNFSDMIGGPLPSLNFDKTFGQSTNSNDQGNEKNSNPIVLKRNDNSVWHE